MRSFNVFLLLFLPNTLKFYSHDYGLVIGDSRNHVALVDDYTEY